jgi:hypothetical protein
MKVRLPGGYLSIKWEPLDQKAHNRKYLRKLGRQVDEYLEDMGWSPGKITRIKALRNLSGSYWDPAGGYERYNLGLREAKILSEEIWDRDGKLV